MSDADTPAASNTSLPSAADRMREAAKWLVASIGAIGAVVVVGISFGDLGELIDRGSGARIAVGLFGLALATAGALWMLIAAVRLASAGTVTLAELQTAAKTPPGNVPSDLAALRAGLAALRSRTKLAQALDYVNRHDGELVAAIGTVQLQNPALAGALGDLRDENLAMRTVPLKSGFGEGNDLAKVVEVVSQPVNGNLGGFPSIQALASAYSDALTRRHTALDAYWAAPAANRNAEQLVAEAANGQFLSIHSDVIATLQLASFLRLRHAFRAVQWQIVAGFVTTIIGIALFVSAAQLPPTDDLGLTTTPVAAVLTPTSDTRDLLRDRSGDGCTSDQIDVLILAADSDNFDVAVPEQDGCTPSRLTVPRSEVLAPSDS